MYITACKRLADKSFYLYRYVYTYVLAFVFWWLLRGERLLHGARVWTVHCILCGCCQVVTGSIVRRGFNQPPSTRRYTTSRPKWMFVSDGATKMGVWWWYQRPCLWKHHYLHVTPQSLPIVRWLPPPPHHQRRSPVHVLAVHHRRRRDIRAWSHNGWPLEQKQPR